MLPTPKLGNVQSAEHFLLHLLSRIEAARRNTLARQQPPSSSTHSARKRLNPSSSLSTLSKMRHEIRTIELWRSVMAECLASFLYVFLLCATHLTWTGSSFIFGPSPNWLIIALTSGFTMATLIQCFGHISGGHVNSALTCAFLVTRKVTPLRALLYIAAHCCGAIAGAALLYGVTVTGNQSMGPLGITTGHDSLNSWQILAVEFILTFVVVFTTYATLDTNRRSFGSDALAIGLAYLVASLTGLPASGASMNPARSLGPAFVMNRWQYHWVYWLGPISGAIVAGLIYEFLFDSSKCSKVILDHFDDLERDSNVEDDYEDPELNKMTNNHKAMYSSASAASSGSSSGQRSNHTQHSIVSVHGPPGGPNGGGHFEPYRPMIGAFAPSSTIPEVSPQIYNEPTNGSNYYQSASDRNSSVANSSGGSANGPNSGTSTFFHPNNNTATGARHFGHNTMRASLPHHRINFDGSILGPKF